MTDSPPGLAELLSHEHFLRRLARSLIRDREGAEDLLQETWLRAVDRRPRSTKGIRTWLAKVLRSVARDRRTAERRRRSRERQAARPEALPSVSNLVELERIRRELVTALLNLGEDYRQVLLLRYYEDLPPRRIAERLNLGAAVVRTRLHRGLAELRVALRRQGRTDSRGLSALAGMPAWSVRLAGGVFGGLSMKKYVILGATALLLGLSVPLWLSRALPDGDIPATEHAGGMQAGLTRPSDPPDVPTRLQLGGNRAPAADFHGRVLHSDGQPAAGLAYTVVADDFRPRTTFYAMQDWVVFEENGPFTGDGGEFRIPATATEEGYLWLKQSETHYAAFDLRNRQPGAELELNAEGVIELRCLGLLPDQEFGLSLWPSYEDPYRGGSGEATAVLQQRESSTAGPALEIALHLNADGVGAGAHRFSVVQGFRYKGSASSPEYRDPPPLSLHAGQSGDFFFDETSPSITVEVLDEDGELTEMTGRWLLDEGLPSSSYALERGLARLDWSAEEATAGDERRFFLFMANGERLELDLGGRPSGARVQLHLGSGSPGIFIPCEGLEKYLGPDDTGGLKGRLEYLFDRDEQMLNIPSTALGSWMSNPDYWAAGKTGTYFHPSAEGIGINGLPETWEKLFLVFEDGRVAEASRENVEQGYRWLSTEPLPELDLRPLLSEHPPEELFQVSLLYGLHPHADSSAPYYHLATIAYNWSRQPRRVDDPHGKEIAYRRRLPDTLEGLQAPAGVPCWFRIFSVRGMTVLPAR